MSILEAGDIEDTERIVEQMAGRAGKRIKIDNGDSEGDKAMETHYAETEGYKGKGAENPSNHLIKRWGDDNYKTKIDADGDLVSQSMGDSATQDDSESDGSIPEIHMGDSDDEDE